MDTSTATTFINSVSSAGLGNILNQIVALVPTVLPAVIGFLAFRKGWGFIKSAVRGA